MVNHEELIALDDLGMIVKLFGTLWTWTHMRLLARAIRRKYYNSLS
jgi:hypothetical protein